MKDKVKKTLFMLYSLILGIFLGIFIVEILEYFDALERWESLLAMLVILVLSYFIQIIIHEAGHLVFGLWTGYQFLSFRIGKWVLIKQDTGYTIKRYHIPGTAGQCLLIPPEDDQIFKLYHAGGVLMNLIVALICGLLLYLFKIENMYVTATLLLNILIAIATALMNGIPMNANGICNDGYNLWISMKDDQKRKALYLQLDINAWLYQNKAITDYPVEKLEPYLHTPAEDTFYAPLIDFMAIYHMAKHQFDKAYELLENLYHHPQSVTVVKNEIICDYTFVKMILGASQEEIDTLLKPVKKYIKMMEPYTLSKIRLQYLYLCLYDHDENKKVNLFKRKKKYIKNIPQTSELTMELELIDYIHMHYDV